MESIIQRTFEDVAFECSGQVEVLPVEYIKKPSGNFIDVVKKSAQQAEQRGIMVLCIHADADAATDTHTFDHKIHPAFTTASAIQGQEVCKNLVAIVPIQMTEAWMLSDKDLLKAEVGTDKSNVELGLHRSPEDYADPKQAIEAAIRIARQGLTRRHRHELTISELYLPIGQKIALNNLENLSSYQKFKAAVRDAFVKLNYLY